MAYKSSNIRVISTTLNGNIVNVSAATNTTGDVSKVSANTLAINKLQGIETPTASVKVDNTNHTIAVNVNTDTMLEKEEAMAQLEATKQEIEAAIDYKIGDLDLIGYEIIETPTKQ